MTASAQERPPRSPQCGFPTSPDLMIKLWRGGGRRVTPGGPRAQVCSEAQSLWLPGLGTPRTTCGGWVSHMSSVAAPARAITAAIAAARATAGATAISRAISTATATAISGAISTAIAAERAGAIAAAIAAAQASVAAAAVATAPVIVPVVVSVVATHGAGGERVLGQRRSVGD